MCDNYGSANILIKLGKKLVSGPSLTAGRGKEENVIRVSTFVTKGIEKIIGYVRDDSYALATNKH